VAVADQDAQGSAVTDPQSPDPYRGCLHSTPSPPRRWVPASGRGKRGVPWAPAPPRPSSVRPPLRCQGFERGRGRSNAQALLMRTFEGPLPAARSAVFETFGDIHPGT
jgi:hypothetical protein